MLAATNMFIESLEKWTRAVQAGDLDDARHQAEQIRLGADLLVIRPEFLHCFERRCNGFDTKEALRILTGFLACAVEGRAHALGQRLKDGKPSMLP
jgi:hypothetical protein